MPEPLSTRYDMTLEIVVRETSNTLAVAVVEGPTEAF